MIDTDIAVIGAGPTGLFRVFEAGLLGMRCHLIDSLSKPGGQCSEIYPNKPIYDIPAYPEILAGELVDKLLEQIKPFSPGYSLGETAEALSKEDDKFIIKIMRYPCDKVFLEGQIDFLKFIDKSDTFFPISKIYKSIKGNDFEILKDENGNERYVWIVRKIEGELFSDFKPKTNELMLDLGKKVGKLDLFSKHFTKDLRIKENKWNLTKPFWIENHFSKIKYSKIKNVLN